VTDVVIRSRAPTYGGIFARSLLLGHLVTSMHVATEPSVIRNFVLLKRGDQCTIKLRRETERVLRAQPFIADAEVTAYPDGPGHVSIVVSTIDEPQVVASLGIRNTTPYVNAVTFGNTNVGGRGVYAVGGWREGYFYRDTYWFGYSDYQLFRRPDQLQLRAARNEHGYDVTAVLSHPFFSELQPRAWRLAVGGEEDLMPFRSPGRPIVSLGVRREYADVGAGVRLGGTMHLGLLGLSLSTERGAPGPRPVLVTDSGVVADTTSALIARYAPYRSTRINVLGGYRLVNFLRVTGFDALAGAQDVRRGIQLGATIGRGLRFGTATHQETFLAGDVYGGVGSPRSFAALEVMGEGRHDANTGDWDALLLSGRLGLYFKPHHRHTIVGSLEFASGRRQRLPFQLSLGDARGGVRGYNHAELGGAERLVGRIEERWRVGTIRGSTDAGIALFADAGKLWAGDAPLGTTTPLEPAIGIGILGAIPPGSQRLWRLDLAVPLRNAPGAKRFELRFSSADRTRVFYAEPNDVRFQHERTVPASVFTWP
jgi:hypothetical protein